VNLPGNPGVNANRLHASATFTQRGLGGDVISTVPFEVKVAATMITLAKKIQEGYTAVEKIKDEQLVWKRKLANMDQLERQARGELVKLRLQKTTEGRGILRALTSNIAGRVKKLQLS